MSKKKIQELLNAYKEKRRLVINPDNITDWEDIGFQDKPDEYDSIEDFLENDENSELDERQQISLGIYDEIISDLEDILGEKTNEKRQ